MSKEEALHDARRVLEVNRLSALSSIQNAGVKETRELLHAAHHDLLRRISAIKHDPKDGAEPFTLAQLRATLKQVEEVTRHLAHGMHRLIVKKGAVAAKKGVQDSINYLAAIDQAFAGAGTQPLALKEAAMLSKVEKGVNASVLRRLSAPLPPLNKHSKRHRKHHARRRLGILQRYGVETIGDFEQELRVGLLQRKSWRDMAEGLKKKSHFLREKPAHWAHRIVRTECMGAYNRAHHETVRQADEVTGDFVKILSATFDDRTGADSYAVHGQIRRPDEDFDGWYGPYEAPPNRPNDREIIVPHRTVWPIPEYLEPCTDDEVEEAYDKEKHKAPMPERPEMSTIDRELFGQDDRPKRRRRRRRE